MDNFHRVWLFLLTLVLGGVSGITQAATYNITAVLDGSNTPGYNASALHDSSGSNVMSGSTLASISDAILSGTYNDVDGRLIATLAVSNAGPSFSIDGYLLFGNDGTLLADSTVLIDFDGSAGALVDTTIGFWGVDRVCCSGIYAPNSFEALGDNMLMTLWGANFTGDDFSDGYNGSTVGMDLVLEMSPVPVPAAVWLFGSGLLGLVGIARRR